eukprot:GAHX01001477.1.p1 GENE.GAHX01001477.1~~GAHX01001477.1.p1  ORF type:complete len:622 (-),score=120.47 GAHX01001477.1:42-1907(-)
MSNPDTIGRIRLNKYKQEPHLGYDKDSKPVARDLSINLDEIDEIEAQSTPDSIKLFNKKTGSLETIPSEKIEKITRLMTNRTVNPNSKLRLNIETPFIDNTLKYPVLAPASQKILESSAREKAEHEEQLAARFRKGEMQFNKKVKTTRSLLNLPFERTDMKQHRRHECYEKDNKIKFIYPSFATSVDFNEFTLNNTALSYLSENYNQKLEMYNTARDKNIKFENKINRYKNSTEVLPKIDTVNMTSYPKDILMEIYPNKRLDGYRIYKYSMSTNGRYCMVLTKCATIAIFDILTKYVYVKFSLDFLNESNLFTVTDIGFSTNNKVPYFYIIQNNQLHFLTHGLNSKYHMEKTRVLFSNLHKQYKESDKKFKTTFMDLENEDVCLYGITLTYRNKLKRIVKVELDKNAKRFFLIIDNTMYTFDWKKTEHDDRSKKAFRCKRAINLTVANNNMIVNTPKWNYLFYNKGGKTEKTKFKNHEKTLVSFNYINDLELLFVGSKSGKVSVWSKFIDDKPVKILRCHRKFNVRGGGGFENLPVVYTYDKEKVFFFYTGVKENWDKLNDEGLIRKYKKDKNKIDYKVQNTKIIPIDIMKDSYRSVSNFDRYNPWLVVKNKKGIIKILCD